MLTTKAEKQLLKCENYHSSK